MIEPYLRINVAASAGYRPGMREIAGAVASQIAQGRLEGCRLPPIRVLAHQLGVSKNTVAAAYEELKARGLVHSRDRKGLFVAPSEGERKLAPNRVVPLPQLKTLPEVSPAQRGRRDAVTLSSVFIDPTLLPRAKLEACLRSVLKTPGVQTYSDPQGYPPLRRKIAQRLKKRGIEANPDHVVITIGSQQVLDLACRSIASRVVATENPAYYVGKALFEMNGMRAVGLPVDPFTGVDLDAWEALLQKERPGLVYLTTNFQNPTGYSYSTGELSRILDLAVRYGFGILEDDWGSEMLSYSEFRPSLRALGGDNVLYMNSFTKKLLPSLRLGYVLGNEKTLPSLLLSKRVSTAGVPTVLEATLFEFLNSGYYDAHLRRVQKELDARYRNCLELLRAEMPEPVQWTSPGGGPILWVECPRRVDLSRVARRLAEKSILIQTAEDAFFGPPHLHGFKIGYAFIDSETMGRAIAVLAAELKRELS